MKVNKNIQRGVYEYKTIIELNDTNAKGRMCNCCKCQKGIRQDLRLGCNNYSVVICICDECLIALHDMIGEYLEKGADK